MARERKYLMDYNICIFYSFTWRIVSHVTPLDQSKEAIGELQVKLFPYSDNAGDGNEVLNSRISSSSGTLIFLDINSPRKFIAVYLKVFVHRSDTPILNFRYLITTSQCPWEGIPLLCT